MKIPITKFAELRRYAESFAAGKLNLVVITSEAGLGKSTLMGRALNGRGHIIDGGGGMSALGLYTELYENQDKPILIDDIDKLYTDTACIRLLKALTQTERRKVLAWHTFNRGADSYPPNEFSTTSPVCIVANEFLISNANTRAIADRGVLIEFNPPPDEVHLEAGKWCDDTEVYDYIGSRMDGIVTHSFRAYYVASQLHAAGHDWKAVLQATWNEHVELIALRDVHRDPSLNTSDKRIVTWCARTGLSRKTYYRICAQYPHVAKVRAYGSTAKKLVMA